MNLINKNNYESFLLDYAEGNLSPESTAELMLFLENHPELKEDLEDFDLVTLEKDTISFDQKEDLKITDDRITPVMFDDVAIAEIEGENSPEQSIALKTFLTKHPEKQQDFDLYQRAILRPALVRFDDKEALYQEDKKVIPLYWWYSAAAAVAIIVILLNGVFTNDTVPTELQVAEENQTETVVNEEKNTAEENTFISEQVDDEQIEEETNDLNLSPPIQVKQHDKRNKVQKKVKKPAPIEDKLNNEEPQLAIEDTKKETNQEILQDSIAASDPIEDYYADQVKIVYEDESEAETTANPGNNSAQKNTKFDVVRAAVKQQLKGLFSNAKKDAEVLTARAEQVLSKKNTK